MLHVPNIIEDDTGIFVQLGQLLGQAQVDLDPWLQEASESELPELCRFASGIQRDKAGVLAVLSLAWSNGPVEAQVQKLKLVKRQMFGRAKFDLLRQRVLHRV